MEQFSFRVRAFLIGLYNKRSWKGSHNHTKIISITMLLLLGIIFGVGSEVSAETFYISPRGSDSNLGTSASSPWKTFDYAIPELLPGDTLILRDGTYTKYKTGLPKIFCGKNAENGTANKPITIKSENERLAFLKSDGSRAALRMEGCSYWMIEGLRGENSDKSASSGGKWDSSVFLIRNSSNVKLKRLLAARNNRYLNTHGIVIANSYDSLIEECEVYYFHRHGIEAFQSDGIIIKRSYANSRGYSDIPDGYKSIDPENGDSGIILYGSSNSIVENSIGEGGIGIYIIREDDNLVAGSISLNSGLTGFQIESRGDSSSKVAENSNFINVLAVGAAKYGFRHKGAVNTRFTNCTAYNSGIGVIADAVATGYYSVPTASIFGENFLVVNNSRRGIWMDNTISDGFQFNYVNFFNNYVNYHLDDFYCSTCFSNVSQANPRLGDCLVYIPAVSSLKGAGKNGQDIGANIIYRYENGVLTNQKLWNQNTGGFPCGAIVPGLNDIAGESCFDVHKRLNVGVNGCPIP